MYYRCRLLSRLQALGSKKKFDLACSPTLPLRLSCTRRSPLTTTTTQEMLGDALCFSTTRRPTVLPSSWRATNQPMRSAGFSATNSDEFGSLPKMRKKSQAKSRRHRHALARCFFPRGRSSPFAYPTLNTPHSNSQHSSFQFELRGPIKDISFSTFGLCGAADNK
jgi:hypothetical protein